MNNKKIYIILFAILYAIVGIVSTIHAVSFFALANVMFVGIMLAIAFEVGQAAVLFSILTDIKKRKKVMPWVLMSVLTIVQVMGNVYSSYKYLITNSEANLRYFKEPIFVWTDIPDATANVLLVYLIGGVLPVVSLLMTAMLTSYLGKEDEIEEIEEEVEEDIEDNEPIEEQQTEEQQIINEETIPEQEPVKVEKTNEEQPTIESHTVNL